MQAYLCLAHGAISSLSSLMFKSKPHRPWRASLCGNPQISLALHNEQMTAIRHKVMTMTSLTGPACMTPPDAAHGRLGCCLPSLTQTLTHKLHLLS